MRWIGNEIDPLEIQKETKRSIGKPQKRRIDDITKQAGHTGLNWPRKGVHGETRERPTSNRQLTKAEDDIKYGFWKLKKLVTINGVSQLYLKWFRLAIL